MASLADYLPESDSKQIDIEDREYTEFKELAGKQITIHEANVYIKDDIEKFIMSFGKNSYTVTAGTAVVETMKKVLAAKTEMDTDLDLVVTVVQKKSKKNGKFYFTLE